MNFIVTVIVIGLVWALTKVLGLSFTNALLILLVLGLAEVSFNLKKIRENNDD
jgi:Kef-type K+ transport system membrane component KefB